MSNETGFMQLARVMKGADAVSATNDKGDVLALFTLEDESNTSHVESVTAVRAEFVAVQTDAGYMGVEATETVLALVDANDVRWLSVCEFVARFC